MEDKQKFITELQPAYTFEGPSIVLGSPVLNGEVVSEFPIKVPLKTINRHGLIAGATGTGKTKSLQAIAEQLSLSGVPVLVMDIKGDLSGISQPGTINPKITERMQKIGINWNPITAPAELLSISDEPGVKLKATVTEYGPVLLSKILNLSDVQAGTLSMLFKYADDNDLPLIDIKDLRKALQYISTDGKEEIETNYGLVSIQSVGAILRSIVMLEEQGAEKIFGEPSFEVKDLMRLDENGRGYINILRLTDIQAKPAMFSTFMLSLLAELYEEMPEKGDAESPELVVFLDEAHLIFKDAPKVLLDQIETIIKLIRSKGIGIFFITQSPDDIPDAVLGQLGFKLQHALRAFTEKDRKAIKKAAENYPISSYYKADELLTQLGIGEAFITVLNEKGIPTPLAYTMMIAPGTRMDVISEMEKEALTNKSELVKKYNIEIDRESAYEILQGKIQDKKDADLEQQQQLLEEKEKEKTEKAEKNDKSIFEEAATSSVGKIVLKELTRGLLGILGVKSSTRKRRSSWF